MSQTIDCFFIGHNEMDFGEYEKSVREMGVHSGAYRDLGKNFIRYNNVPYHISEIFNILCGRSSQFKKEMNPLTMGATFNLAIAYLGTFLHSRKLSFDYVNAFRDEKEILAKKLAEENILAIAIITTLYISVFPILEIVQFIKKYNTTAKIIIGGPFISNQVRSLSSTGLEYIFKAIDADFYVNSSQGEATLVQIIEALKNNVPLDGIPNIHYKHNGGFRQGAILREDNRLAENMVNWDLFSAGVNAHINVRTSISCPFSCSFCGFPQHAGQYQIAGVKQVEQELRLVDKPGKVKSVQFIDDTFNVPVERFKEILEMMINNRFKFRWHSHFRCQFADQETVALMKESGCEGVFLGLESGSDHILKIMNKATTAHRYLKGIDLLKKYGILTYGSFIIGFPGETPETVQETITFIKESGIDFFRTQLWYCDTTTPIWKEREKYEISGSNFEWKHATLNSKTASDMTDEIFLAIEDPIWIPQYNFEFDGLFHLIHRGFSLEQVKRFLKAFNKGLKEKLTATSQQDVSWEVITELETALETHPQVNNGNSSLDKQAVFDF